MIKSLSKKFQQKHLTYLLVVLLLFILTVMVSFIFTFYLPTAGWLSYKSNLVPLSFKYPKDWPISQCSEPILFPQMKIEEVISFENECDWMQSKSSLGSITIEKLTEHNHPKSYIDSPLIPFAYRSNLKEIKIGNKTGYLLIYTPNPKYPPIESQPKGRTYYVVANNLVYTIRLLERTFYKGSETETTKTFEKMLTTFQF